MIFYFSTRFIDNRIFKSLKERNKKLTFNPGSPFGPNVCLMYVFKTFSIRFPTKKNKIKAKWKKKKFIKTFTRFKLKGKKNLVAKIKSMKKKEWHPILNNK